MNVAFFAYHRKDDNILDACVASLHGVSHCEKIIVTDGVPEQVETDLRHDYGVRWIPVDSMVGRRAACKVQELARFSHWLYDGDILLASDVDVYYLTDPFQAMLDPRIDVAVTTRGYDYPLPINGGIFYVRISPRTRRWLDWHAREVINPSWPPYVEFRKTVKHENFGIDWTVGQDWLIASWLHRDEVLAEHGVRVVDVGPHWNFCPAMDVLGEATAFETARQALRERNVAVLHLKSHLKELVYEGIFPCAWLRYEKGTSRWL